MTEEPCSLSQVGRACYGLWEYRKQAEEAGGIYSEALWLSLIHIFEEVKKLEESMKL